MRHNIVVHIQRHTKHGRFTADIEFLRNRAQSSGEDGATLTLLG